MPAGFVPDLLGPENDAPVGDGPRRPTRSYAVCSTPRSGSGLLCRGLAAAGAFGAPLEYFNPVHRGVLSERWGCGSELEPYVQALHSHRTTDAGIFGVKLHWAQMAKLRSEFDPNLADEDAAAIPIELIETLFPSTRRLVRIVRVDLDLQAVSYWRALHSNLWSEGIESEDPVPEPPPFDFDGIDRCRTEIETGENCWSRSLDELRIEPLIATYEDLESDYEATIERVAAHVAPDQQIRVVPQPTRKLRDGRSIELMERFRDQRRSLQQARIADPF
jgi:trehalose 2-sulfotransferase